jgi:hypothetical protein
MFRATELQQTTAFRSIVFSTTRFGAFSRHHLAGDRQMY